MFRSSIASLRILPVCASMFVPSAGGGASASRLPARLVPSCDTFWPSPGRWARAGAPSARVTASAIPVMTKRNEPLACCSMALSSSCRANPCLLLELKDDSRLHADALDGDAALDLRVVAPAYDRLQRRVVEDVLRHGVDD